MILSEVGSDCPADTDKDPCGKDVTVVKGTWLTRAIASTDGFVDVDFRGCEGSPSDG